METNYYSFTNTRDTITGEIYFTVKMPMKYLEEGYTGSKITRIAEEIETGEKVEEEEYILDIRSNEKIGCHTWSFIPQKGIIYKIKFNFNRKMRKKIDRKIAKNKKKLTQANKTVV